MLVTLEIPSDAKTNLYRKDIADATKAKYRCNKAKVLKIEDSEGKEYSKATSLIYTNKKLKYVVGEKVKEKNYNEDIEVVCGEGIHFFLDKEVALLYGLDGVKEGIYQEWYDNGQKEVECTYKDINLDGLFQSWFDNGQKRVECHFRDGEEEGLYQIWYREADNSIGKNGQKEVECHYKNGKQDGRCQTWHRNGQKEVEC